MYPNETAEHHRDHRCRNKEVNQFCYDPISKYRGNFCGCITRHHPVWAGSRSWVSRHLSLHLSIRGDEVRVRSCLIFRYRIWPKKQCILEKHNNLLQNIIRVDYCWPSLISICHLMKQENIAIYLSVLQRFDSAFFKQFGCSPRRGGISYTKDIFHCECKRPPYATHKISSLYLKNKHHILPPQKKIPLLLNRSVQCNGVYIPDSIGFLFGC